MREYLRSRNLIFNKLANQFRIHNPRSKGISYEDAIKSLAYIMVELIRDQAETQEERQRVEKKVEQIYNVVLGW